MWQPSQWWTIYLFKLNNMLQGSCKHLYNVLQSPKAVFQLSVFVFVIWANLMASSEILKCSYLFHQLFNLSVQTRLVL